MNPTIRKGPFHDGYTYISYGCRKCAAEIVDALISGAGTQNLGLSYFQTVTKPLNLTIEDQDKIRNLLTRKTNYVRIEE